LAAHKFKLKFGIITCLGLVLEVKIGAVADFDTSLLGNTPFLHNPLIIVG
jgi:hypothetical protein